MKWFFNLRISVKLLAGFITVAMLAGVVGIIGTWNMSEIDKKYTALYEDFGASLGDIGLLSIAYQRSRVSLRDIILNKDPADKQKSLEEVQNLDKVIDEHMGYYQKSIKTEEGQRNFQKLVEERARYQPIREKVIALSMEGKENEALQLMSGQGLQLAKDINNTIEDIFKLKIDNGRKRSDEISLQTETAIKTMLGLVVFAVFLALVMGISIARKISRSINALVAASEKVAAGDLNVMINTGDKDEIGDLAVSFKRMTDNINQVLLNIQSSSEQLAAASRQVAGSSQALSQGSTEQASAVEELSASLEEISNQTKQNAISASDANELANTARENASHGDGQMTEMLRAMEDINESSANISKIIKVIDEIAFQTNILALNAAVEAARAGQHGKGFAVVAEEVRNLAARSANAAKETTTMIEGSIKKVDAGTKIARETAGALKHIVEKVTQAAYLVTDIAAASNEQSAAISQINQGIMQVSQVTQTNSATAEESASASEELSNQAEILRNMAKKFKLNNGSIDTSLENLRPDIIKMLEGMADHNGAAVGKEVQPHEKENGSKIKISLGDNDFGKY